MYCQNCGVELESSMVICPLCKEPADGQKHRIKKDDPIYGEAGINLSLPFNKRQRKFTWEIITIILGAGVAAAFAVDFIINKRINWSEYTTATGLTIFCYVSIFAFWKKTVLIEMILGFAFSSLCLLALDVITGGIDWAFSLAIPLLLALNVIILSYIGIVRSSRYKGINLIAYGFLCAALLCISTEGIVSFFTKGFWQLQWNMIVATCVLPVSAILLYIHFRLKKGQDLKRTFHI